jgi:hypothetical protein
MPALSRAAAIAFADQLRLARHSALSDAEGFDAIIHTVERLGSYLTKEKFCIGIMPTRAGCIL